MTDDLAVVRREVPVIDEDVLSSLREDDSLEDMILEEVKKALEFFGVVGVDVDDEDIDDVDSGVLVFSVLLVLPGKLELLLEIAVTEALGLLLKSSVAKPLPAETFIEFVGETLSVTLVVVELVVPFTSTNCRITTMKTQQTNFIVFLRRAYNRSDEQGTAN